ncbi:M23 family metallopeptidase [Campylobacter hyointestinalis]|uniref:Peptidase M23 n=1 Tax=Campylobacter hyointestinalis subsp. hyointestinalis TaxID=91352 RepID=A0A855NAK4_CAMHY|nr:M23 family metallopeptidase [Campylobacter hyointestinalis]ANE33143.1 zinc metallopeptidase, M23 family [Campylobacter hyointestinalis subsp. hyointestinalis LMG 9260]PPB59735.1 peptidase M23 [Campylobacter hyointestinalis subsp. hyointestinalis]PPB64624.1 peptidase M23 [Campylobacter hyointestinalis subsp. hyointestinalis]PPB72428.1 peptidase M23 [Campylobacter hyointestinalis subsp. hyointestinalis]SUW89338.1 peptidase M23B [Campylobacter hyointestinalis]
MRKNNGLKSLVYIVIILVLVAGVFGVLNSSMFEKNSPKVALESQIYWNLKDPIPIKIEDESGIKFIKVILNDGASSQVVMSQEFKDTPKQLSFNISFPKRNTFNEKKNYTLIVEATDNSKWNFFRGNEATTQAELKIDTKRPELYALNQSYKIAKGGSAAVVFRASDSNLDEVYIMTSYGKKFKATPFYKEGYYASLVAWPVSVDDFSADIVAVDKAKNRSSMRIKYFLQDRKYRVSKIALNDRFLDGKILDLTNMHSNDPDSMDKLAKFKFINETLRISNEKKIAQITSVVPEESINSFYVKPFYPLKNGAAVASFGDHRYYTYNGQNVSESWHLGLDLASTAGADIVSSNNAIVAFNADNGIYGLNMILYHGFGLYTLYGHCNSSMVNTKDMVSADQLIGTTGTSGLALGDHLHFGVLVQGVEVRPEEWMDTKWMKDNIYDVLELSKQVIDKK